MFTSQLKTVHITALFATMFFALLTINLFHLYKFNFIAKNNLQQDELINSIPVDIFVSNINEIELSGDPIKTVGKTSLPASFSALDAFKNQTNATVNINAKESADGLLSNDGINPTSFIQTFTTGTLDLKKRRALKLAQVSHSEESGIVEVIIKVDPNGNVISAEANGRKTNTANKQLKNLACNAALNSFFEPLITNEIQTGSIIYNFDF